MEEIYDKFTDIDDTQADTKFLATLDEDNIADTAVVDVSKNTPYSCNSEMEQQRLRQQQRLNDLAAQIDDLYDELPTTKSGKLLKQYVKSEGFGSHLVAIFDEWFMRSMKDNIQSRILTFNDGNYVSFENLRVDFPRYGPNKIRLTPKFAREQGITYGCDLYVSPILRDSKGVQLAKGEEYFIGNVPIMLKSYYCILHGKNAQELALFGEDPNDPDGIFIVDGVEKVIQGQEQLATDKILLMDTGEAVDVRMTASTATRGTILLKISLDKDGVIEMNLPNMKAPKEEAKNLNVLRIFRLLVDIENERVEGQPFDDDLDVFTDEDTMKDNIEAYLSRFIKEENRDKCLLKLTRNFVDLFIITDDKGVVAKNMGKQTITNEEILKVFDADVFPQVNNMPLPDNITEDRRRRLVIMAKLNLLSIMTARMLEYLAGVREVNDRDSWSNKRVESSGRMMEGILRKAWKKALGLVEDSAAKISSKNWISEVKKIKPEIITMSFHDSFITNNWGVKGSPMKNNVAQTLNRDSVVASYAHVNIIDVGISRTDRSQKPRLVQNSQFGLVSHISSPEGTTCLDRGTLVLNARGENILIEDVKDGDMMMTYNPETKLSEPSQVTKCFAISSEEHDKKLYEITLINGKKITTTGDHPMLVESGFIPTDELRVGIDHVAVTYVPTYYSDKVDNVVKVMNPEIFRKKLSNLDNRALRSETIDGYMKELDGKGLLEISNNDPKMIIIARILGYTAADGHVGISVKRDKGKNVPDDQQTIRHYPNLTGYFGTIDDGNEFRKDIKLLGFDASYPKLNKGKIIEEGTGREVNHSVYRVKIVGAFAALMISFGATIGRKTERFSYLPDFLRYSSLLVKREFLSGINGGDGGSIRVIRNKSGSYSPCITHFTQSKRPGFVENGHEFMDDIAKLFEEFDVKTTVIREEPYQQGTRLRLNFEQNCDNIIRYMYNVGFRYCPHKLTKSLVISEYLIYRDYVLEDKRKERADVLNLYINEKLTARPISFRLGLGYGYVENIIKRYQSTGKLEVRTPIPKDSLSFDKWVELTVKDKNTLYIPTKSIVEVQPDTVYDYTTVNDNHTIICANGIVSHNCGILKNINICTKYTLVRNDSNIIRYLLGDESLNRRNWVDITYNPTSIRLDFIMVGGKFIGWCDGEEVQKELINKRRQGLFCYDMAVVKEDNFVYVDVSPSRPVWPLLVVDIESQRLMIDILDMRNASNYELLTSGCVEYMSAWEQEYIKLAINEEKITERLNAIDEARKKKFEMEALLVNVQRNGPQQVRDTLVDEAEAKQRIEEADKDLQKAEKARAFTHCIIDGLATLDVAAALIPWPNHNQAPRNSYQVSMGKQALGIYHSNHLNRMLDGKTKLLAFPNRPMVSTDMYDVIGLDNKGPGENVNQAFMAFPYTEEDAFIVKKEFLDNGGFRIYKYLTYKTIINESNSEFDEFLCHPNDAGGRQLRSDNLHRYRHIQRGGEGNPMAGLPQIGAPLFAGDAIIGKVQRSKVGEERGKIRDESVIMRVGDEGVVEKVTVTSYKNKKTVIVKLRVMRVPEEGDKFAPRNAQKGTIGLVMSDIDLPFSVSTGITPDFIMNTHSLPSRMTMSYPMEVQGAKSASMSGIRINGGAFHKNMLDEHRRTLKRYGMHEFGYEEMRSGTSAEPLEALIASGPLFVQALKHHVKDKIQARGTGPVNPATRQGTRGRSARGGLRWKARPQWRVKALLVLIHREQHIQIQGTSQLIN